MTQTAEIVFVAEHRQVDPSAHWLRAHRANPMDPVWQRAITLPDEICGPIGKAVLDELVARGLAAKGPAFQPGDQ